MEYKKAVLLPSTKVQVKKSVTNSCCVFCFVFKCLFFCLNDRMEGIRLLLNGSEVVCLGDSHPIHLQEFNDIFCPEEV